MSSLQVEGTRCCRYWSLSIRPLAVTLPLFYCHMEYCEDIDNPCKETIEPKDFLIARAFFDSTCVFKKTLNIQALGGCDSIFLNAVNWKLDSVFAVCELYK